MTAIETVGNVTGGQKKEQPRQKEREPGVAQVNGAMRDGIDLPSHRDGLRLGTQDDGYARKLVSPEIAKGKRLHALS
jgi:hypothetical protein